MYLLQELKCDQNLQTQNCKFRYDKYLSDFVLMSQNFCLRNLSIITQHQMTQFRPFDDNDIDLACLPFIRGISQDTFVTNFFPSKPQTHESLMVTPKQLQTIEQQQAVPDFSKYKAVKQEKKKSTNKQKKDYKKNICGYITKKIVRQFMAPAYKDKVQELCQQYGCNYYECREYYDKKIERITGPTHLDMLLNSSKEQPNMKKCFKEFFIWFLRHRYLRYLIAEGKMQRKDIYIDYKNKTLLYLGTMQKCIKQLYSHYSQ